MFVVIVSILEGPSEWKGNPCRLLVSFEFFESEQGKTAIFDLLKRVSTLARLTHTLLSSRNQVNQPSLGLSLVHSHSNKAKWVGDVSVRDLKT